MPKRSYFKCDGHVFFFDPTDWRDTRKAWDLAKQVGKTVSVYRLPECHGPWDRCQIIGYRHRGAIVSDISAGEDCYSELESLDAVYLRSGRIPMSVAA